MAFRYTINEVENTTHPDYMSDLKLLRSLVVERKHTLTNYYTPLAKRLSRLYETLNAAIIADKPLKLK